MNEKVPPTASNRRKRELAREGDLVIYKRKRKTIDPSTVVPPNTVDSANEGVGEGVNILTESVEGEGATSNDDVGPSDKSLLRSFRFHRAKSIALGQDLNAFKSLKVEGAENSLSLKKLKEHYAYKLEKVLSDGTVAAAKKKKGLTSRSVARTYMLYVLGSFLFPNEKENRRQRTLPCPVCQGQVINICTFPKAWWDSKEMDSDAYEHCTCWKWDVSVTDRYGGTALLNFREALDNYKLEDVVWDPYKDKRDSPHAFKEHHEHSSLSPNINLNDQQITALYDQLQKLKEDKDKESEANINLREALKEKTSKCDLLKETIEQMKAEIELKRVVDEQCVLEFADLPRQLDAKILECKNLEEKNTSLEAELRSKSSLEDCNQSLSVELNKKLAVLQSHQPVPDTTLAKKYKDLLAAHEDVKKKLIAKEDFRQKLVNAEERMKSKANNRGLASSIKEVASEGMGDMGDPTFEELFEQNKIFFTIAQQGPKIDYQEDLFFTVVTLENVVIARREKMAKKKKMQELLFQPWTKYLVDVRGVEINDNNSGFRVCSYGHQHVEYRHMVHLLATYYEKVVVFISHTEAYIFLPLFWARKRNTTSNEERFQNLVMDTSKYWWFDLGADNHFVRLFPRFDAAISPLSTIFYSHVNLEIPLGFMKEQLTRYFDVRVRNFKALLREHKYQGYRVNDMVAIGLSTIK
ncbi:hypothetical protein GIB67_029609 [Kingdonia uniflora]|uniref:Uncharacterized protein n=1 Tax=Kingdonia uniflora TaxID=39325 RepID=A0A7J7LLL8_9MAGN|nr:hypothetical protein GIB67_029609 [Kingdonia uniflora]